LIVLGKIYWFSFSKMLMGY